MTGKQDGVLLFTCICKRRAGHFPFLHQRLIRLGKKAQGVKIRTASSETIYKQLRHKMAPIIHLSSTSAPLPPALAPPRSLGILHSASSDSELVSSLKNSKWVDNQLEEHSSRRSNRTEAATAIQAPQQPNAVRSRPRPTSTGSVHPTARRVMIRDFRKSSDGIYMYNVDVECPSGPAYTIRRRFSDFKKLHASLNIQVGGESLPQLPAYGMVWTLKTILSDERALESRKVQLQRILDAVAAIPHFVSHASFYDFIGQAPSTQNAGYVSLDQYCAPRVELQDEIRIARLRKRATSEPALLRAATK